MQLNAMYAVHLARKGSTKISR